MNAPHTRSLPMRGLIPAPVLLAMLVLLVPGCTKPSVQAALPATQPGPRTFTLTCLRALPPLSQGNAVAASESGGATRYGVCVSGTGDNDKQSWWKLQGTTWKVLGRGVKADATADDVAKMQYGVPAGDVAALLEQLSNVRADAAKRPIHFGVPTPHPQ